MKEKYTKHEDEEKMFFCATPEKMVHCYIKLINDNIESVEEEEIKAARRNKKSAEGENWKLLKLTSVGGKK